MVAKVVAVEVVRNGQILDVLEVEPTGFAEKFDVRGKE